MWNEPNAEELSKVPGLYSTEKLEWKDTPIHMHFFYGGSDWYAAEYSPEERNFFGYAILNSDYQNAEWGYFPFDELRATKIHGRFEIDYDLHWRVRKAGEVEKIVEASSE